MSKKTIRKFLRLIFSNADINIHHLKMSMLIKKIVAHIDSIGIAHKSEVTQLNDVIDELTTKLINEQIIHGPIKNHLHSVQADFDTRTSELIAARLQISSLETQYAILKNANDSMFQTLNQLAQTIQAHQRLKNPLLKDYKNCMSVLESTLIANDIHEE